MGHSIWKSLLATALTGGASVITFWPSSDIGASISAPSTTSPDLQPPYVVHSLAQALSETPAATDFTTLIATTQGEQIDQAIDGTTCARVIVLRAVYSIELVKHGLQVAFVTQLLEVSKATYERSTVAALEYRSPVLPFTGPTDPVGLTDAFASWLAEQNSTVQSTLREAISETALMTSRALQPPIDAPVPVPLGKDLTHVLCDDCRKSDLVILAAPARAWIQPTDNPRALRSLPMTP